MISGDRPSVEKITEPLDPVGPEGFQLHMIMKFVLSLKFVRVGFLSLSPRRILTSPKLKNE